MGKSARERNPSVGGHSTILALIERVDAPPRSLLKHRTMPRPSFTSVIALSLFAVVSLAGCKTIYTDMYRPTRNHFKPEKEKVKPTDVLPTTPSLDAAPLPAPAPQAPGLEPAAPGAADPAAPAAPAPAAPPAIPGL